MSMRAWSWMFERRRDTCALAAAVVTFFAASAARAAWPALAWSDRAVLALLMYMLVYFGLTAWVFTSASHAEIVDWADREDRGTVWQRYLLGSAPGPGVSLFFAAASLIVAMVWLPGHGGENVPTLARMAIAVALIIVGWASVAVSFAVTFYADNLVEDGQAMYFPADGHAVWSDYVYFAVSVMTTFGTTDVDVVSKELRRTVTANAVIAFVFNTVTIAAVVSALAG